MVPYWTKLRPTEEGWRQAFEELCCQLAASEEHPSGSAFIRKAPPDAGVECFWTLPSGEEHGWQAKFFDRMGKTQWRQLDESFLRALDTHPRLVRYVVCLPMDRSDPRISGKRSMAQRWAEWERWCAGEAERRGRTVSIDYWGTHEIQDRLTEQRHTGRRAWWFGELPFDANWFRGHVATTIADAGERYVRDLHVALEIEHDIDALARSRQIQEHWDQLVGAVRKARNELRAEEWERAPCAKESVAELLRVATGEPLEGMDPFPFESVRDAADRAFRDVRDLLRSLGEELERRAADPTGRDFAGSQEAIRRRWRTDAIAHLLASVGHLHAFSLDRRMRMAEQGLFLLTGEAGAGKTHLLARAADLRAERGLSTLFILGGQLGAGAPWQQIIAAAGLPATTDKLTLLGALEAAAQAAGSRTLVLIDALNESRDLDWRQHLAGLVADVRRFPAVALAVSVRSTYLEDVVPSSLLEMGVEREHHGFDEHTDEAVRRYFDHYGIRLPGAPLLPELRNPLFLKLTCQALHQEGADQIPARARGIAWLFGTLASAADRRAVERLGLHRSSAVCSNALRALGRRMLEAGRDTLPIDDALGVCAKIHPASDYSSSVLRVLIDESLLIETVEVADTTGLLGPPTSAQVSVVTFSYQRHGDWMKAACLLEGLGTARHPKSACATLVGALMEPQRAHGYRGVLEALAVLLPERFGVELADLAGPSWLETIGGAVLHGLRWRTPGSIDERAVQVFDDLLDDRRYGQEALEVGLVLAPRPDHPLNARHLHRRLMALPMVERDRGWTIPVVGIYQSADYSGRRSELHRLHDWSRSEPARRTDEEVACLVALTLAWTLTSSHRQLRDRSTKALVALCEDRPRLLVDVLEAFGGVDDLYVAERLMAVACGCSLRTHDPDAVRTIATAVAEWAFGEDAPQPHLLVRDYARTVLERALHLGVLPETIEPATFRPPYGSEWPDVIPPLDELCRRFGYLDAEGQPRTSAIVGSVVYGDFRHYVLRRGDWVARRLDEPPPETADELLGLLSPGLTEAQVVRLELYRLATELLDKRQRRAAGETAARGNARTVATEDSSDGDVEGVENPAIRDARPALDEAETVAAGLLAGLRAMLEPTQRDLLDRWAAEAREPRSGGYEPKIPPDEVARWMLQRILEHGWRPELFEYFDRQVPYSGRNRPVLERIGKKLQWIAWHEATARLADTFAWVEPYRDGAGYFEGPWRLFARGVDPTVRTVERPQRQDAPWWSPVGTNQALRGMDDPEWFAGARTLPDPGRLLRVTRPEDGSEWLVLEAQRTWKERLPEGAEDEGLPQREAWMQVRAWLCRSKDAAPLARWVKTHDLWGPTLPHPQSSAGQVMLMERWWAPSWRAEEAGDSWHEPDPFRLPVPVVVTAEWFAEDTDTSEDPEGAHVEMLLPSDWLVSQLDLSHGAREGEIVGADGRVAFFDPGIIEGGPNALLMRADLVERLEASGFALVWTAMAEKKVVAWRDLNFDLQRELRVSGCYELKNGQLRGELVDEPKKACAEKMPKAGPRRGRGPKRRPLRS